MCLDLKNTAKCQGWHRKQQTTGFFFVIRHAFEVLFGPWLSQLEKENALQLIV